MLTPATTHTPQPGGDVGEDDDDAERSVAHDDREEAGIDAEDWVEQVGRADEPGHELALRLLVDLAGRADLLDAAGIEHGDAVGEGKRFLLVVSDEQEGDADIAAGSRLELYLHLFAQLEIEGAEGLVEEEHAGPVDEGAGQRDALALPTGELPGRRAPKSGSRTCSSDLHGAGTSLLPADLLDAQAVLDVLEDAHMREQGVVLEHRVGVAVVGLKSVTSRPPSSTRPDVGVSKPAIIRSTVVLPEPEGPSIEKNSPSRISSSMSSTATTGGVPGNSLRSRDNTTADSAAGVVAPIGESSLPMRSELAGNIWPRRFLCKRCVHTETLCCSRRRVSVSEVLVSRLRMCER